MRKIRLAIVDDSAFVVKTLCNALAGHPEVEVIWHTTSGREAVALVKNEQPDVLLLDVNMPEVDGAMVTQQVMETCPTRILLLTALAPLDLRVIRALELGAIDMLAKDGGNERAPFLKTMVEPLLAKIRAVIMARLPDRQSAPRPALTRRLEKQRLRNKFDLILIGLSTGGPAALTRLLKAVPNDFPLPILVVQHISDGYSESLAKSLQMNCPLVVKESANREEIKPGVVYIAKTDKHMEVSAGRRIHFTSAELCRGFRPSVDVLFKSAAANCPDRVLAVVLTGMGNDGMDGACALKEKGHTVIIQDEASSVVWGMPGEIYKSGQFDQILSLDEICEMFRVG